MNAKAHMFVNHYSISTGTMTSVVGAGAKYGNAYKDSDGEYLMGDRTYRLDLPPNPPSNLFWSVAIYAHRPLPASPQTGRNTPP